MSIFLFVNGQAVQPQQSYETLFDSRAWRYGDALFETMLFHQGSLLHAPLHAQRIVQGTQALGMEIPPNLLPHILPLDLCQRMLHTSIHTYRIRLTIVRTGGGLYAPLTNHTDTFISATPYPFFKNYIVDNKGISVTKYPPSCIQYTPWSAFKTANALPFVMAAQYATQHQTDDALLCNAQGNWVCGTSSNLFVYVPTLGIITPPLTEGCVAGTIRHRIMQLLTVGEQPITPHILAQAHAAWLTNTTQGIRWIHTLDEYTYTMPKFIEDISKNI